MITISNWRLMFSSEFVGFFIVRTDYELIVPMKMGAKLSCKASRTIPEFLQGNVDIVPRFEHIFRHVMSSSYWQRRKINRQRKTKCRLSQLPVLYVRIVSFRRSVACGPSAHRIAPTSTFRRAATLHSSLCILCSWHSGIQQAIVRRVKPHSGHHVAGMPPPAVGPRASRTSHRGLVAFKHNKK
jgi:hypothetical protein